MAKSQNTQSAESQVPQWTELTVEQAVVGAPVMVGSVLGGVQSKGRGYALVTTQIDPATGSLVGLYGNQGNRAKNGEPGSRNRNPTDGGLYAFIGTIPDSHAGIPQFGQIDGRTHRAIVPLPEVEAPAPTEASAEQATEGTPAE